MLHDETNLRIYLAHRAALIDYAAPIVGGRAHAEDVVQEAYLRFVPRVTPGRTLDQPAAYLYRIVRNLALDWARRIATENVHRQKGAAPWAVAAPVRTPEQETLYHETLRRVSEALAELPQQARLACEMYRFGGYTLQEIADRLHVSVPTAHRLVRTALAKVAYRLSDESGAGE